MSNLLEKTRSLVTSLQKGEKPILRSPDSYIPAVNTARFLTNKHKILIVGDAGGRDWAYLSSLGKEVYVVDIAPQTDFPNLIQQSIEEKTPFPDDFFDGVVMNEVLEHLFYDAAALEEVHRILKGDGVLVVTVPYYSNDQDSPEYHVRVHSPKTIQRLLESCGFRIQEHFFRGFCSRLPQLNKGSAALIRISQRLVEWIFRKTPDESVHQVNAVLEKLERRLGSRFQRLFTSYGGIMWAKKTQKKNFHEVQKAHFGTTVKKST